MSLGYALEQQYHVEFSYLHTFEAQVLQGLRALDASGNNVPFEPQFEDNIIRPLIDSDWDQITSIAAVGRTGGGKGKAAHDIALAVSKHPGLKKELRRQGYKLNVVSAPYAHSARVLMHLDPRFQNFKIGEGSQETFELSTAHWNTRIEESILSSEQRNTKTLLVTEFPFLQGYPYPHIRPLHVEGLNRGIGCVDLLNRHERTRNNFRLLFLDRQETVKSISENDRGDRGNPDKDSQLQMIFTYPAGTETPFENLPNKLRRELVRLRQISQTPVDRISISDNQIDRVKEKLKSITYEFSPYDQRPILGGETDKDLLFAITRSLGVPDNKVITPINEAIAGPVYWHFSYLIQMNMWAMRYPQVLLGARLQKLFAQHIAESPYRFN